MTNKRGGARNVALGGVLLALALVVLFLASYVPGIELCLYAVSSLIVMIAIMELGLGLGALFYLAVTLLSFVLIPARGAFLLFGAFFGAFPFVKYAVESRRKRVVEIIVKLLFFNAVMGLALVFFRELFFADLALPDFHWLILAALAQPVVLLYDMVLTLAVGYYRDNLRKKINRE